MAAPATAPPRTPTAPRFATAPPRAPTAPARAPPPAAPRAAKASAETHATPSPAIAATQMTLRYDIVVSFPAFRPRRSRSEWRLERIPSSGIRCTSCPVPHVPNGKPMSTHAFARERFFRGHPLRRVGLQAHGREITVFSIEISVGARRLDFGAMEAHSIDLSRPEPRARARDPGRPRLSARRGDTGVTSDFASFALLSPCQQLSGITGRHFYPPQATSE